MLSFVLLSFSLRITFIRNFVAQSELVAVVVNVGREIPEHNMLILYILPDSGVREYGSHNLSILQFGFC